MKKYDIGFVGYGNMARAIASALSAPIGKTLMRQAGYKLRLAVSDSDSAKLADLPRDMAAALDNRTLISDCDVIIAAVKPQNAAEAFAGTDMSGKILISIMASVTLDSLAALTEGKTDKIVRVMPNLNARIGSAYSAYCCRGLDKSEREFVSALLHTFGEAAETDEKHMNISTGLCGSAPAFVFKFINALIESGRRGGLDDSVAREMALQTVIGSAYLVEDYFDKGGDNLGELVASVCSKGGTTIEGVGHLDANDFENAVIGAVEKAAARAEEMGAINEKR